MSTIAEAPRSRRRPLWPLLTVIAAVVGVGIFLGWQYYAAETKKLATLNVGGTSTVGFMMDKWVSDYRNAKNVDVVYESSGSTAGIKNMIDGKYSIGFTHAPLTPDQLAEAKSKGGDVLHVPVVICAVVPIYNIKDLKFKNPPPAETDPKKKAEEPRIKFTADLLADIFLQKIEMWNDPAIAKLNPDLILPEKQIKVVHRADSSGTTFVFADYLYNASDIWKKAMGKPKSVLDWPVVKDKVGKDKPRFGKERNNGVAAYVRTTEGAIGYVDLLHAESNKIPQGAVQNAAKNAFVIAEPKGMTAAAKSLGNAIPSDLTFELLNKPGSDTYPICSAVWAVCYKKIPGPQKQLVVDFLQWITHEGQKTTNKRKYAPLTLEIVGKIEEQLKTITE